MIEKKKKKKNTGIITECDPRKQTVATLCNNIKVHWVYVIF